MVIPFAGTAAGAALRFVVVVTVYLSRRKGGTARSCRTCIRKLHRTIGDLGLTAAAPREGALRATGRRQRNNPGAGLRQGLWLRTAREIIPTSRPDTAPAFPAFPPSLAVGIRAGHGTLWFFRFARGAM